MTKEHFQLELLNIWEHERKTVLFVTHDLEEALVLGTRAALHTGSLGTREYYHQNEQQLSSNRF